MGKCYAEDSRGIACDRNAFLNFGSNDDHDDGWICRRHYDILAKLQEKPSLEERQQKKIAGTLTQDDHPLLPDKEWWDRVLLPSYRDEEYELL